MNKVSLPLCIADEPRIASFDFSKRVTVRVSLANPGAEDLANELAKSFARLTVSTAEEAALCRARALAAPADAPAAAADELVAACPMSRADRRRLSPGRHHLPARVLPRVHRGLARAGSRGNLPAVPRAARRDVGAAHGRAAGDCRGREHCPAAHRLDAREWRH